MAAKSLSVARTIACFIRRAGAQSQLAAVCRFREGAGLTVATVSAPTAPLDESKELIWDDRGRCPEPCLDDVATVVGQAGRVEALWRARAFTGNDCSTWECEATVGNGEGHEPVSQPSSSHEVMGSLRSRLRSNYRGLREGFLLGALVPFSFGTVSGIIEPARVMHSVRWAHTPSDEWLVQRARADKRRREARDRRYQVRNNSVDDVTYADSGEQDMNPDISLEEKLMGVLGRPDLIITRNVEWANLAFGFEQQNKYVIMDPREPHAPVGYILEDSNVLMRQFLRRRRPFTALVLDAYGNEIFRVRRPAWLITSTIYVEVDGQVIGEAHRRWHLWKRIYDIYLGNKQFAVVENPGFWYWTFTLQDEKQRLLAVIDRNWRGFGYEFLTDAGQYVVRFGDIVPGYVPSVYRPATVMESVRAKDKPVLAGSPSAVSEIQSLQTAAQQAEPLVVDRPLTLPERAMTLALAVSVDNDYFSNHSAGIGFVHVPFFGGQEVADADRNLPLEDESPFPPTTVHDSTAYDVPSEPAEPLERVIESDDTAGEPFYESWNEEDVEEAIFGDSPAHSWTQVDESQGDADIFDTSGFFGQDDK